MPDGTTRFHEKVSANNGRKRSQNADIRHITQINNWYFHMKSLKFFNSFKLSANVLLSGAVYQDGTGEAFKITSTFIIHFQVK